ncbi:MAG: hypothetical protein VX777_10190 [Chlamydiota bacterium]|nr:hypothetical protein [Chlamydiota bacterium]
MLVDQVLSFNKKLAKKLRHNSVIQRHVTEMVLPFRSKSVNLDNIFKASKMLKKMGISINSMRKDGLIYYLDKIKRDLNDHSTGNFQYPVHFIPPKKPDSRLKNEWNTYCKLQDQYEDYFEGCSSQAEKEDKYYKELQKIENKLNVGDILFIKLNSDAYPVRSLFSSSDRGDTIIKFGQKMARFWVNGPCENDSYSNIHAAIIGEHNGRKVVIEASPSGDGDEVRFFDFDASINKLIATDEMDYRIVRVKDIELRQAAANVAQDLCDYVVYSDEGKPESIAGRSIKDKGYRGTRARYAKAASIKSVFKKTQVNSKKIQLAFQDYARYQKGEPRKNFFCSSLVTYSFMIAKIDQLLKDKEKPDFTLMTSKQIKAWSKEMRINYKGYFEKKSFFLSPLSTSPQKLHAVLLQNPQLFKEKYRISPYSKLVKNSDRVKKVCENIQMLMSTVTKEQTKNIAHFLSRSERSSLKKLLKRINRQYPIKSSRELKKISRISRKIEFIKSQPVGK